MSRVTYNVLLFGDVKAAAGLHDIWVESPAPLTARQLLTSLVGEMNGCVVSCGAGRQFVPPPAWKDLVRPAILAVDLEYIPDVDLDCVVRPNAEIALIPPISGG